MTKKSWGGRTEFRTRTVKSGYMAFQNTRTRVQNSYRKGTVLHLEWDEGWLLAKKEQQESFASHGFTK